MSSVSTSRIPTFRGTLGGNVPIIHVGKRNRISSGSVRADDKFLPLVQPLLSLIMGSSLSIRSKVG